MPRFVVLLTIGVVCLFAGCEAQPPAQGTSAPVSRDAKRSAALRVAADPRVTVELIDAQGFQSALAKHQGKVVLVDCWAMWCLPCIQGFPATVALSQKHAQDGLVVISLSFDSPEDENTKAKLLAFLEKQHATFENYVSRLDLEQGGVEAFHIEGASLPHYNLYDRSGKLLKSFSNSDPDQEFSHKILEAAVEEALQ